MNDYRASLTEDQRELSDSISDEALIDLDLSDKIVGYIDYDDNEFDLYKLLSEIEYVMEIGPSISEDYKNSVFDERENQIWEALYLI